MMTKTIEEAAKSIAKDFIMENKNRINNDAPLTHECVQYAVERVMSLPLASRLTTKEKERVRKAYKAMSDYGNNKGVECASCANYAARVWMECIFGTDFFKEGE